MPPPLCCRNLLCHSQQNLELLWRYKETFSCCRGELEGIGRTFGPYQPDVGMQNTSPAHSKKDQILLTGPFGAGLGEPMWPLQGKVIQQRKNK